jgi:glutamate synthase (NADPH/NADH) large chain
VKLVAEAGVGTIASGVAKAHADVILISGGDGGTGASPISSIRHTGLPWELGLAEAHQTLVANNLRSRVTLQADGQIKTGKDIAVAALLGAEEWGMATSALVVLGCLMMRQCHNNTCPTGIATQNADLRALFKGKPEYLTNYFTFLAQDLREIMAEMGFRTVNEMIGQSDFLKVREDIRFWKAKTLNLSAILYKYPAEPGTGLYKQIDQEHGIEKVLDFKLLELARPAFTNGTKVYHELPIVNVDRTTGALLSNEISKKYKDKGLPTGTIHFKFKGSAGQSFGAFNAAGLRLELEGEANDYFGKGLSGGELIVYPDKTSTFKPHDNVIIGNVAMYGATSGEAYIRGIAGQRFCVRNSGVKTVVEGVGNHGCEYMTGGVAIILGSTGKNFAAGMSGGVAYVYDFENKLDLNCNKELVNLEAIEKEDEKILKHLIGKHNKYTGSLIAGHILDHFEKEKKNFVKVMPVEYKAAIKHLPLAAHVGIEELDGD